jgi:hypothetical protein
MTAHIDVLTTNQLAQAYRASQGWKLRTDSRRFSWVRKGVTTFDCVVPSTPG